MRQNPVGKSYQPCGAKLYLLERETSRRKGVAGPRPSGEWVRGGYSGLVVGRLVLRDQSGRILCRCLLPVHLQT